jgi:hypothetical protein
MIERQRRAKQRSAEAGKWKGGRRPYGYQANGITVREDEAQAVADTTTAVLAGASIRGLIKAWNAAGRRTTSGNKWATNSFRTMVLRVRNAGLMEHRGQIIGKAEWPAIVPESQWRALVDLLHCLILRSSQPCSQHRESSEPSSYAAQLCWAKSVWTVASVRYAACCLRLWRLNRQVSRA